MTKAKKPYVLEIYHWADWFWRLRRRRNGKIVADGSEGYTSKSNVMRAVDKLPLDWSKIEKVVL